MSSGYNLEEGSVQSCLCKKHLVVVVRQKSLGKVGLRTGVKTSMESLETGGLGTAASALLWASMKSRAERMSRRDCA